ncbi:uncharacterized protein Z518_02914 [Rhinocladiella mackenziei CBS 650.93]|uniref:MYND-type zinc finger protein samB n=1 Tax=Rhinocladiella mackenziei CBS 650.93 TaxID=1442369 RepID=A0A0D2HCQ9_9EURO|nr:uncharacterized protein Z518_02914 [Rhinocladiella mackenziei CBS 650.93]KIX08258.1 hypothetical protein Z518_02914 [Rhinocladiella mackenziei CBS 650.93]
MREVNFSIPNVNKASVHITTTLYDRRALDCTSTLPLINSLNHLAYLTTSSARIRDILTVDGGIERLVCILKEGRSKDEMHMWKWNLAFQCIVNIGVRGSENVRTRVVEADMVPVIATILWDYILVIEMEKLRADAEQEKRNGSKHSGSSKSSTFKHSRDLPQEPTARTSFFEHLSATADLRSTRRQAPPPSLDLPQSFSQAFGATEPGPAEGATTPAAVFTSPPERTVFPRRDLHQHNRSQEGRGPFHRSVNMQPPATAVPSMDTSDGFSLRPVREADRLPSMLPPLNTGVASHPDSPTTPSAPSHRGLLSSVGRRMRRPSIRHQNSTSDDHDDVVIEDVTGPEEELLGPDGQVEGQSRDQTRDHSPHDPHDIDERESLTLTLPPQQGREVDNVDIAQQTPIVAGMGHPLGPAGHEAMGASPIPAAPATAASPAIPLNAYPNFFLRNATATAASTALIPRDEDVLMGLQLLAYISKYCYLRHYFQATHLVPRLRIDREVERIYGTVRGCAPLPEPTEDEYEEFLQPDDYNIFPLVEKFTVRHHSKDMQYWACVVMRNLCRKDDARGGIRQCANYKCGKWEEYTRQFAKCRRCRRTKYCSKVRHVNIPTQLMLKWKVLTFLARNANANHGACTDIGATSKTSISAAGQTRNTFWNCIAVEYREGNIALAFWGFYGFEKQSLGFLFQH